MRRTTQRALLPDAVQAVAAAENEAILCWTRIFARRGFLLRWMPGPERLKQLKEEAAP